MTPRPATCPVVRIAQVDLTAELALKLRRHAGPAGRRLADEYLSGEPGRATGAVRKAKAVHVVQEGAHVF